MNEIRQYKGIQKDKKIRRAIFWFGVFGIAFFLFCDFGSYKNWFNCQTIVYLTRTIENGKIENYSVAKLMYNSDEYFLLMALTFAFWYCTRKISIGGYMSMFIIDLMGAGLYLCLTKSPEWGDWDAGVWVMISGISFIIQIILYYTVPSLRKLKLF